MADRAILDSSHRDGKIDPEELGNAFQLLRHKMKKVSCFLRSFLKTKSPNLTVFFFLLLSTVRYRRHDLGGGWWLRQVRELARVPGDVSSLSKWQHWCVWRVTSILQSVRMKHLQLFLIPCNCSCSSGYEPRRLFNVVEFLMNDKDDNGSVSVEEAMQILYLRHGRSLLDTVRNFCLQASPTPRDSSWKLTQANKKNGFTATRGDLRYFGHKQHERFIPDRISRKPKQFSR